MLATRRVAHRVVARDRGRLRREATARPRGVTHRYIGVDVGGTFTDIAYLDGSGRLWQAKSPSRPDDPVQGVLDAVDALAAAIGTLARSLLESCDRFAHGSTIGTNALLTRRGPGVAFLTTAGFRDTLAMRRGHRDNVWAFREPDPAPLVPRHRRIGIRERIDAKGGVIEQLREDDVEHACAEAAADGVTSFAIGFLFGYLNPVHEERAAEIVRARVPGAFVTISSGVVAAIGEYDRFSTTVVNAFVGPTVGTYLRDLETALSAGGLRGPIVIAQSSGGLADLATGRALPASLALSGPAAGVAAARWQANALATENVISVDMGGTSFDVAVVANGRIATRHDAQVGGHHIALPMVDVHTIGTGGGSLARVDRGGFLRVGPEGAGSVPGPAGYGRGGRRPTVTDANLVVGRLRDGMRLPGGVVLRRDLALAAIGQHVAQPLVRSIEDAAIGILAVATAQMADAMRIMTVERGLDPRNFTLLAVGGAAPQHVSDLARALGATRAYVPSTASVFCAQGMLSADIEWSAVHPVEGSLDQFEENALNRAIATLVGRGREALAAWLVGADGGRITATLDARYAGRHREFSLDLPNRPLAAEDATTLRQAFNQMSLDRFGHADPDATVEHTAVRVTLAIPSPRLTVAAAASGDRSAGAESRRRVVFAGGAIDEVRVVPGRRLADGDCLDGPAMVEDAFTTTVLLPGDRLRVDATGGYLVEIGS
ncbi:MAG: hydantoinase/oxoprolinase family protein [Chloroflexota bacterium]|nr:MAG: hydantoinase/oxoprolinase family protein [Chloroflexota bacterium]